MTPSESSHRDLSIEHNFTFGHHGPPCRHSPHARTALPAADFAAAVAARPTLMSWAPAVPKIAAALAPRLSSSDSTPAATTVD
eukprot:1320516-Prymnesium_polylepis.1